jgi:hypothetical protein
MKSGDLRTNSALRFGALASGRSLTWANANFVPLAVDHGSASG